jgi:hypothetical protein
MNQSEILIDISDFQNHRDANVSIVVNVVNLNTSESDTISYLLQVPFNVSNVEVDYWAWFPSLYGGSFDVIYSQNMSFILVNVPKANVSFGLWRNIGFRFRVDSLLSRTNRYNFEGIFTFSNSFYFFADDINEIQAFVNSGDTLYYFLTRRAILNIEDPVYYLTEMLIPPDNVGYWDGKTWYRYDLQSRSSSAMESISISTSFHDPIIQNNVELRKSLTLLTLGSGISLILSAFSEIIKIGFKQFFTSHHQYIMITALVAIIPLTLIFILMEVFLPVM